MKYSIIIQYDETDGIYVASIPEIQGCMAHGKTQAEALKEVQVVYEMYVDEANETGRSLPSPDLFVHAV